MSGRVQKGDFFIFAFFILYGHLISAYVLGYAASLFFCQVGFSYEIKQCGFAMINMTHDADHGLAFFVFVLFSFLFHFFENAAIFPRSILS